ncbi:glycosyltransferase [Blautia glucerasea]|uniref:glycosyltransferase n=2 Tax=Bacillota TaxID=1239 RepID=UPI001D029124|nr:glycosyltransferase [Blautia glucerasea]MCB5385124.1 glycosyltransferase [Blautia glucerasea]
MEYSVLISVYYKEKAEYLIECLESMVHQTVQPSEIVIVKDGKLTAELEDVLTKYKTKYQRLFKFVCLEKNVGLGLALAEGIKNCSHELIARMDSDDISIPNRCELQLREFAKDSLLDVCGGYIKEFCDSKEKVVSIRKVPLVDSEIKEYQKRRDAVNHVTVMFKKSKVLEAGNYQHALLMEDSLLWTNMILHGATFKNIDDYLVYVRTGADMFKRRGGLKYFKKYKNGRKIILQTGYISKWDYYYTLLVQLIFSILPNSVREFVYEKLLRSNKELLI